MATCEECGGRRLVEEVVGDAAVLACDLCGALQGDAEAVARALRHREARERGFDPVVYPLVTALETVPTFTVDDASAGRPERAEYPYVFLRVAPGGLVDVEHLLTSLEMANRATTRRWVVECSLQHGLLFILRPRFWKAVHDISTQDIAEARADLPILADILARDVRLAWWQRR